MSQSTSIPENHIARLSTEQGAHDIPSNPSYGIDSPLGLIASNVLAPLYLYETTKGLLKIAQIKQQLAISESYSPVQPAYGIDLFVKGDQSGNSRLVTYKNAAALGVCEQTAAYGEFCGLAVF